MYNIGMYSILNVLKIMKNMKKFDQQQCDAENHDIRWLRIHYSVLYYD